MWPFWIKPSIDNVNHLISSAAGGRAFASGGPAWRSGAAGTQSWGALDSGESHAAAGGPPLQTQHHHLLHEAQVDPYALEAWPQGRLRRGDGAPGGESGVWWRTGFLSHRALKHIRLRFESIFRNEMAKMAANKWLILNHFQSGTTLRCVLPTRMQVLLQDWLIVWLIGSLADWATPFVVQRSILHFFLLSSRAPGWLNS